MKLKNKVAIITGAKQGIGKGIALALAKEGAKVVISDLDLVGSEQVAQEIRGLGGEALALKCDVSNYQEVKELVEKTVEEFGSLDILVNNAGVFPFKPFSQIEESDWDWVMDINMKGVFFTTKEALKVLPEGARIINISSVAAVMGFPGLTHYCASKGALNAFTRALALELAPRKITVNNIAPGGVETPGTSTIEQTEEEKKQVTSGIPLARLGQPDEIAQAVVYLASEGASYTTGQTIVIDGGMTIA